MSQPVAQSGSPSICSNPWKDEGPLITWPGLTVRASCSGSSSGEQKSGAELVIQQKRLMIMDGVCSLWLNSPFACRPLPSLHSSSVHLSLPSSSVISCTSLQNVRYPPDYKGTSHYCSLMRTDLTKPKSFSPHSSESVSILLSALWPMTNSCVLDRKKKPEPVYAQHKCLLSFRPPTCTELLMQRGFEVAHHSVNLVTICK